MVAEAILPIMIQGLILVIQDHIVLRAAQTLVVTRLVAIADQITEAQDTPQAQVAPAEVAEAAIHLEVAQEAVVQVQEAAPEAADHHHRQEEVEIN